GRHALAERAARLTLQRLVVELLQLLADVELPVERVPGLEPEPQVVDQGPLLGLEHELDAALGDHLRGALPVRDHAEELLGQARAVCDQRAGEPRNARTAWSDVRRTSPVMDVTRGAGKRGHPLQSYETGRGRGMCRSRLGSAECIAHRRPCIIA